MISGFYKLIKSNGSIQLYFESKANIDEVTTFAQRHNLNIDKENLIIEVIGKEGSRKIVVEDNQ